MSWGMRYRRCQWQEISGVEEIQFEAKAQKALAGPLSLLSPHSASSVESGMGGWPYGPLGLQLQMGLA